MLDRKLVNGDGICRFEEQETEKLHGKMKGLKDIVVNSFREQCGFGFYTLTFHLLGHIIEDVKRSGSPEMLESSLFKSYDVYIKIAYR